MSSQTSSQSTTGYPVAVSVVPLVIYFIYLAVVSYLIYGGKVKSSDLLGKVLLGSAIVCMLFGIIGFAVYMKYKKSNQNRAGDGVVVGYFPIIVVILVVVLAVIGLGSGANPFSGFH